MKKFAPLTLLVLVALLLSGCPDSKMPKPPPKVPEPKLLTGTLVGAPSALMAHGSANNATALRRS